MSHVSHDHAKAAFDFDKEQEYDFMVIWEMDAP